MLLKGQVSVLKMRDTFALIKEKELLTKVISYMMQFPGMIEEGVTGAKLSGDIPNLEKHEHVLLSNWKLVKDHKVTYKETFEMRMLRGLLKTDL